MPSRMVLAAFGKHPLQPLAKYLQHVGTKRLMLHGIATFQKENCLRSWMLALQYVGIMRSTLELLCVIFA